MSSMPVVAHSSLPTFAELRGRGQEVLDQDEALKQDIRELHIGLLNMMPDAALRVTERQFIQLAGTASQIVQLYVHPFTVPGLPRSAEAQSYIDAHYETFEQLQADGLDALIVTGANVSNPQLDLEPFWEPLQHVMAWALDNVTSVLCSCLATHALVQHFHGVRRRPLLSKRWGVYEHRVLRPDHPLLWGTNTRFDVPHSRWNEVSSARLAEAGIQVLVESVAGDFHLGVSSDGVRIVYLQGHPEYDANSLLKEYKREVDRYLAGDLTAVPPYPENYFPGSAARIAHDYLERAIRDRESGRQPSAFPEADIEPHLDNTWVDTGKALFNNWLGLIYRLTDLERGVPFMAGIDPDDPLGLRSGGSG